MSIGGIKICKICKIEKNIDDYYKGHAKCKSCMIKIQKEYTTNNREKITKYKKIYHKENKEKISNRSKDYYENNKELIKEKSRIYYENNRKRKIEYQKDYSLKNKESISEYKKKYSLENRERRNQREKERKEIDIVYRLRNRISKMTHQILKRSGYTKSTSSIKIIGCDCDYLLKYIESKFEPWMTWDNYGKYNGELGYGWDIDHIIPLSSANSELEIYLLSHYSNLQPLDSKINRDIKRNKLQLNKDFTI